MGMSAWILFAAPYIAPTTGTYEVMPISAIEPTEIVAPEFATTKPLELATADDDIFSSDSVLSDGILQDSAGGMGQDFDIDIGGIASNIADNDGSVRNVEIVDSETGQIANNAVSNNSGITTIFNNTGNGVVFQSSVQVNIFLDGGQ